MLYLAVILCVCSLSVQDNSESRIRSRWYIFSEQPTRQGQSKVL